MPVGQNLTVRTGKLRLMLSSCAGSALRALTAMLRMPPVRAESAHARCSATGAMGSSGMWAACRMGLWRDPST